MECTHYVFWVTLEALLIDLKDLKVKEQTIENLLKYLLSKYYLTKQRKQHF